ncbi:MAG: hypothetical protein NUW37_18670 [Planctomycetes bacterium]|nr:hypothetical protein [Planctomycetota bacterium]
MFLGSACVVTLWKPLVIIVAALVVGKLIKLLFAKPGSYKQANVGFFGWLLIFILAGWGVNTLAKIHQQREYDGKTGVCPSTWFGNCEEFGVCGNEKEHFVIEGQINVNTEKPRQATIAEIDSQLLALESNLQAYEKSLESAERRGEDRQAEFYRTHIDALQTRIEDLQEIRTETILAREREAAERNLEQVDRFIDHLRNPAEEKEEPAIRESAPSNSEEIEDMFEQLPENKPDQSDREVEDH